MGWSAGTGAAISASRETLTALGIGEDGHSETVEERGSGTDAETASETDGDPATLARWKRQLPGVDRPAPRER